MSRFRLAVVLSAPFLFAVLPLLAVLLPAEPAGPGSETIAVVTVTGEVREALEQEDAPDSRLTYRAGAKAQPDCSRGSNPYIDG